MCKEHEHWCSNCGSSVDGKVSKFFDFVIDLKTGFPKHERSVICSRCEESPAVKEMLAKVEELNRLEESEEMRREREPRFKENEGKVHDFFCVSCNAELLKGDHHVALTTRYDVGHKRFRTGSFVLCKKCYDGDPKTKVLWKYLGSIGKNPNFTPSIRCGSWNKCPTYESGGRVCHCKHIAVIPNPNGREFQLVCNRGHPRKWNIQAGDRHLFRPQLRPPQQRRSGRMNPKPLRKDISQIKKIRMEREKKMMKAVEQIKDPGLRDVFKIMWKELF